MGRLTITLTKSRGAAFFTELASPGSGYLPNSPIQGNDGNLYGTTVRDGYYNLGVIFEMPTDGTSSTTLYNFSGYPSDGSYPFAGLVQATDGTFYGTTYTGGSSSCNFYSAGLWHGFQQRCRSRAFCLLRARDGEDRTDIHPARARLHRCDERLAERDSRNLHGEVGYRIECHSSRRSD